MERLFTEHPHSAGESYLQHLVQSFGFAGWMLIAGLSCLVHAVFPFLFEKTASGIVTRLNHQMLAIRRRRLCPPELQDGGALSVPD